MSHKITFWGNDTEDFFRSIAQTRVNWSDLQEISLLNVKFATPFLCVILKAAKTLIPNLKLELPDKDDVRGYIKFMMNTTDTWQGTESYIQVRTGTNEGDARDLVQEIGDVLSGVPKQLLENIIGFALPELLENVLYHAQSPHGFFAHAQKYPGKVEMAVADLGIGIANSMAINPHFGKLSPLERFEKALEMRVTSKFSNHSGEGLSSVLEWIKENLEHGARGLVLSKQYSWHNGSIKSVEWTIWPGTIVWASLPLKKTVPMSDVWKGMGLGPEQDYGLEGDLPF